MSTSSGPGVYVFIGKNKVPEQPVYRRQRLLDYLHREDPEALMIWVYTKRAGWLRYFKALLLRRLLLVTDSIETGSIVQFRIMESPRGGLSERLFFGAKKLKRKIRFVLQLHNWNHDEAGTVLVFTTPRFPGLVSGFSSSTIVYDCSDNWVEGMSEARNLVRAIGRKRMARNESSIARNAHLVLASSSGIQDALKRDYAVSSRRYDNGFDPGAFTVSTDFDSTKNAYANMVSSLEGPKLVYSGPLKEKVSFDNLIKVAEFRSVWNIIVIGAAAPPKSYVGQCPGNIVFIPPVRPDHLGRLLPMMDVGLLPYKNMGYNSAVLPLKLFEYFFAGLPVVATHLPSAADYLEVPYGYLVDSVPELIEAIKQALENKPEIAEMQAYCAGHDWDTILRGMCEEIQTVHRMRTGVV